MATKNKEGGEASLTHQVEDLQMRMQILKNDRKSNMEVLEANKSANKEEIRRLREEGKEFRQKLAVLMKTAAIDDEKDEEKHVSREVARLRKAYDEIRLKSGRVTKSLDELRDSAKDLELDSQRPHMEDNEYTRAIRALENKLDKAMIKYNEAQSIRKTYEQIVRRLKEERVGFDNQLAAIERTLGAKQRDYDELLLLAGDASHAKETALGEKDRVLAAYEEERKRREKELREKHQVVQLRKQMLERMRHREKMRADLLTNEGELNDTSMMTTNAQKALQLEKVEARNKVDVFENAFRKIKEATGVSDVNEVIQKIVSQESSMENLVALTKENQVRVLLRCCPSYCLCAVGSHAVPGLVIVVSGQDRGAQRPAAADQDQGGRGEVLGRGRRPPAQVGGRPRGAAGQQRRAPGALAHEVRAAEQGDHRDEGRRRAPAGTHPFPRCAYTPPPS